MNDHQHDPREVGAAYERHDHDVLDVNGAAAEHHSHTVHDLPEVPTAQQFRMLQDRVAELEMQAAAEAKVPTIVAEGADTIERIAAAIERHATAIAPFNRHSYLAVQLMELATAIRQEGR